MTPISKSRLRWMIALSTLSAMWLAYVVYLDIKYDKFPAVLLGGLKILIAGYLLLLIAWLLYRLLRSLIKLMRSS